MVDNFDWIPEILGNPLGYDDCVCARLNILILIAGATVQRFRPYVFFPALSILSMSGANMLRFFGISI
jgi:hypothetical protein